MDVTTTQLVVTLLKAKSSLSSIGSSPLNFAVVDVVVGLGGNSSTSNSRNKKRIQSVKGDETDDLITKVQNSWLYVVASVGVLSGGKHSFFCFCLFVLRCLSHHTKTKKPTTIFLFFSLLCILNIKLHHCIGLLVILLILHR